jgi:hypothetical protein
MTTPKHTADELLSRVEEIIAEFGLPGLEIYTISNDLKCPVYYGIDVHAISVDGDQNGPIYDLIHEEDDDIESARRVDRTTALIALDAFLTMLASPED